MLDARYHGTTESYTLVNGGFGFKWLGDQLTTSVKVINLLNEDVQQHVFGDILKRQVIGEIGWFSKSTFNFQLPTPNESPSNNGVKRGQPLSSFTLVARSLGSWIGVGN